MITKTRKAIAASGTTAENEPIIKSDGASSNVMQWLSNNEGSNITISEDDSNNLDLVVSSGTANVGGVTGLGGTDTVIDSESSSSPTLTLRNRNGDANGAELILYKRTSGYANDDVLGTVRFKGYNSASEETEYATIYAQSSNVADGAEDGTMIFRTMKDGTLGARLTIDSAGLATFSNGIYFSGQTQTAATGAATTNNELSHYEQGTFTPSLGGNTTYHTQTGEYTRVGRLVSVRLTVFVNAIGTGSTSQISGLPFAVGGSGVGPSVSVGYATLMAVSPVFVSGYLLTGSSTIKMAGITSASASMTAGLGVFGDGTTMNIAASYYV